MKKILLLILVACSTLSFQRQANYFTGKIIYKNQFKDAQGKDITDAMAKVLGKEQHYFISENDYKVFDEENNIIEFHQADSNNFSQIAKEKIELRSNYLSKVSTIFNIIKLKTKETIVGYKCNSIQVITDDATTTYFYCSALKVNKNIYANNNSGTWIRVLKATDGAVPLKIKMINHKLGFIVWQYTATEIKKTI